ncbi:hypothetical protein P152DRAFT_453474 [Eremomyces bilateralis CBS 781.70]|uniref:Cell wall protein n=1 Tax=Eremomyces bilateralis CBS 781.70 TaxID=1392243 RepID=A0A6G1GG05_9PEZI|nr:uncharacterized protein P152DRAFT_453474 [Eremomyces bilateralis CBS 781.70]KAF1816856.1 hypothetical protein P152DRAFT_453474 [Eremomyces bilateralis CBS 781.70]
MKLLAILSAVLGLTLASPVKRDPDTISVTGKAITAALNELDVAIVALTAENVATQLDQMDTLSQAVVAALESGATKVAASPKTELSGALALAEGSQALTGAANKTLSDLLLKKDVIVASGRVDEVLAQLDAQQAGTTKYVEAIIGNLPSIASQFAGRAVGAITSLFDKAAAQFGTDAPAAAAGA